MRREQIQNEILLDTVKRIQGTSLGSLYEDEIAMLRTVIEQKQTLINKLHSEGIELAKKIESWKLKLQDEEDRSRAERERVEEAAIAVEAAIEDIAQDKQLALQRLGQYESLYTRTVDDRNDAESRMLRARELVGLGREDLKVLGECLNQTKAAQEKLERELSSTMARLEASRSLWKSSLEQRKREVDGIIRRHEEAKRDRILEEEEAARQRLEAERVRNCTAAKEAQREAQEKKEMARRVAVEAEQWRVVCAAAGVDCVVEGGAVGSSADAVIDAFDALTMVQGQTGQGTAVSNDSIDTNESLPESSSTTPGGGRRRDTMHRAHDKEAFTSSMEIRAETSLRLIRQRVAVYLAEDEAVDDDELVAQLGRLAVMAGNATSDLWSLASVDDETNFLGQSFEKRAEASNESAAGAIDESAGSQGILSRHEIKARSRKMKAKIDKRVKY